jgi:hypothetical protein
MYPASYRKPTGAANRIARRDPYAIPQQGASPLVEGPRVDRLGSIDYNLTARVAFSVLDTNRRIQTN